MLEPSVARRLISDYASRTRHLRDRGDELAALTQREREIMRHVGHGLSSTEIAQTLVIGESTLKPHVSSILAKLGLRDGTQIAITAYESGLMES